MLGTSRRFVGYNLVLLGFGVVALFVIVATSVLYSRRTQTYAADAIRMNGSSCITGFIKEAHPGIFARNAARCIFFRVMDLCFWRMI